MTKGQLFFFVFAIVLVLGVMFAVVSKPSKKVTGSDPSPVSKLDASSASANTDKKAKTT